MPIEFGKSVVGNNLLTIYAPFLPGIGRDSKVLPTSSSIQVVSCFEVNPVAGFAFLYPSVLLFLNRRTTIVAAISERSPHVCSGHGRRSLTTRLELAAYAGNAPHST